MAPRRPPPGGFSTFAFGNADELKKVPFQDRLCFVDLTIHCGDVCRLPFFCAEQRRYGRQC